MSPTPSPLDVMRRYLAAMRGGDAGEECVALIVRARFDRDDGVVEIRRCNVYRLRREEIVEVWIFEADQYEVDVLLADTGEA